MNKECKACFARKNIVNHPEIPEERILDYQKRFKEILENPDPVFTAPEAAGRIRSLRKEMLGEDAPDFSEIKQYFNALMMGFYPALEEKVLNAEDPLKAAVQYAMTGNFIDFAALDSVEEDKLMELLDRSPSIPVDPVRLEDLRLKIREAKKLTFIPDNCGEIVMDKLLIGEILRMNPEVEITVLVRGGPVGNDACMEDAEQIGLTEFSERVHCMGNGTAMEGTVLRCITDEARAKISGADLVISKGQGNYETLCGCGFNVYYIFMCKCGLFTDRFGVPQYSGLLTYDRPEHILEAFAEEDYLKEFVFREARREETEEAAEVERICFPPNEACTPERMKERIEAAGSQFLVAVDRKTGKIAGFLNGIVSKEESLRDEFFTDAYLHDPVGDNVMLASLAVLPEYRGRGLARELMYVYSLWERYKGRKRLILTCHEEKVEMYHKMGYTDLGLSASVWGGEPWHEMDMILQ